MIYSTQVSQRLAARVAGWSYLVTFALVVFANFHIFGHLVTLDPAQTARNILAQERLFRVGIACDLLYCVGFVALSVALYVILKPVNPGLAFLSAKWKLLYVAIWSTAAINLFDALRLLQNAGSMGAFETAQAQSLARFYLGGWFDRYYAALLFSALGSTVSSYVWFKSRYIPRLLAGSGVISAAFCTLCTLTFLVFPHFDSIVNLSVFDLPMAIVDIVTSVWLLVKGLKLPAIAEPGAVAV